MASFAVDVEKFVRKSKIKADRLIRKIALDAYTGVIQESPVDTGRFRSNWQIGINRALTETITITEGVRASGVQTGGGLTVDELNYGTSKALISKFGDTIHITNSLPYALRLEDGYSQKAPLGMVRITLDRIKRSLQDQLALLESQGL